MHPERRCRSAAAEQLVRTPLNAATPRPPVSSAPRTRRGQTDSRLDAGGQALHNYRLTAAPVYMRAYSNATSETYLLSRIPAIIGINKANVSVSALGDNQWGIGAQAPMQAVVVGSGVQGKSAQHFLPVSLLMAHIDHRVEIDERHRRGTQGAERGKALASGDKCVAERDALGLHHLLGNQHYCLCTGGTAHMRSRHLVR